MKHTVKINKRTGQISWLTAPPFKVTTEHTVRQRFSEIVPSNPMPRLWFRILRFVFGESGRVAEWTRSWLVSWRGEILQGPHKGETRESGVREFIIEWEYEKFSTTQHKGLEKIV